MLSRKPTMKDKFHIFLLHVETKVGLKIVEKRIVVTRIEEGFEDETIGEWMGNGCRSTVG